MHHAQANVIEGPSDRMKDTEETRATTAREPAEHSGLIERAAEGDADAVRTLFAHHRERLKRVVRLRLSRLLQGRVSESEVVDEIMDDAARRLPEFRDNSKRTLFLWLRHLACEKLAEVHRRHLGSDQPVPGRPGELTLHAGGLPVADSVALAAQFLGTKVESRSVDRAEIRLYIQEALNSMDPIDREVLALKHFERLSFSEIAEVLGLAPPSAGNRYLKAIKRLTEICPWDLGLKGP
jgi:RNA polymerase sigma-70 factor, ECF subfamily